VPGGHRVEAQRQRAADSAENLIFSLQRTHGLGVSPRVGLDEVVDHVFLEASAKSQT
jgi:hypothetical protein